MKLSPQFTPSEDAIDQLIARYPLAQLVSDSPAGLCASPLPLLLQRDAQGRRWLLGHMARANPHTAALRERPEALAIFIGPQTYVSPSWFSDRSQAPTWNFATVHMQLRLHFDDGKQAARAAVEILTATMERGHGQPWHPHELGPRYEAMLGAIIAFRAEVLQVQAKFKLGQNESASTREEIRAALARSGQSGMLQMMDH